MDPAGLKLERLTVSGLIFGIVQLPENISESFPLQRLVQVHLLGWEDYHGWQRYWGIQLRPVSKCEKFLTYFHLTNIFTRENTSSFESFSFDEFFNVLVHLLKPKYASCIWQIFYAFRFWVPFISRIFSRPLNDFKHFYFTLPDKH